MLKRLVGLALLAAVVASAKSYTIAISDSCYAGPVRLERGEYTLKLDGDKVVLIDKNGRRIETNAKVETADRKFDQTAVLITRKDGANRIESVYLRGSKSKVVFE